MFRIHGSTENKSLAAFRIGIDMICTSTSRASPTAPAVRRVVSSRELYSPEMRDSGRALDAVGVPCHKLIAFPAGSLQNGRSWRLPPFVGANLKVCNGEGFRTPAPNDGVRLLGPASESLPRRKPRGGWRAGSAGPTYGDFGIADEALAGVGALTAGIDRGGSGDDELFCGGFCERRTQARRLERDWRPCEDVGFLLRRAAGGGKKRRGEAEDRATSIMRCRS